jgi:DNA-binding response OmpR family regulator
MKNSSYLNSSSAAQMKTMKASILYVEDDETLSFVTKDNLEIHGYEITHFADGLAAKKEILNNLSNYNLCILDVMLPEIDGFALAKVIRERNSQIPILFLTAKSLKDDRIHGLKIGADDYITKPFSIEELTLKIEIFLKRSQVNNNNTVSLYEIGRYTFNYKNLSLKFGEEEKILTQKEADLLKLFTENQNEVLKRSFILENVWGEDDYFLGRSLDVFISRLRKYLSKDDSLKVKNIHGVGFVFETN